MNDLKYVARFAWIFAQPEPTEDMLREAYELSTHIRNLSKDESWKAPCSRYREACQYMSAMADGLDRVLEAGRALVSSLPSSAVLEPLNYNADEDMRPSAGADR